MDRFKYAGIISYGKYLLDKSDEFLHSEKSKQGTSPDVLVGDTRMIGTGCEREASGTTEGEGLDAEPIGHKIEGEKICPDCKGKCTDGFFSLPDEICHSCNGTGQI